MDIERLLNFFFPRIALHPFSPLPFPFLFRLCFRQRRPLVRPSIIFFHAEARSARALATQQRLLCGSVTSRMKKQNISPAL